MMGLAKQKCVYINRNGVGEGMLTAPWAELFSLGDSAHLSVAVRLEGDRKREKDHVCCY